MQDDPSPADLTVVITVVADVSQHVVFVNDRDDGSLNITVPHDVEPRILAIFEPGIRASIENTLSQVKSEGDR